MSIFEVGILSSKKVIRKLARYYYLTSCHNKLSVIHIKTHSQEMTEEINIEVEVMKCRYIFPVSDEILELCVMSEEENVIVNEERIK